MNIKKVQVAGNFEKLKTVSKEKAEELLLSLLGEDEFQEIKSILSCDKFRIVVYDDVHTLLGVERYTIRNEFNEDFFIIKKNDTPLLVVGASLALNG